MEYSIVLPKEDGLVFDVGSLWERFGRLRDQRKALGKRYSLALVLVLMILAKLCGEDTPLGIAEWAQNRCQELVQMLKLKRKTMPCHNTYRRVMQGAVDVAQLQAETSAFMAQAAADVKGMLIAIDGKTLRGTIPTGKTQGVHLLAAYLPREGVVLMQVAVDSKENEIVAAPRLLSALDLRGKIVRGDALLTQRSLSVQILEAGGQYVWEVKENQSALLADIQEVFDPAPTASGWGQVPRDLRRAQTVNVGHGRLERRTLTASCFLNDYSDWPGLEQVFKLERQVTKLDEGSTHRETIFGITSLKPAEACPSCLLKMVRGYWSIENGLHYRRDKTLREDAARMSNPIQAQVTAILNNLIVGLVLSQGFDSLPTARRHYSARPAKALNLLLSLPP